MIAGAALKTLTLVALAVALLASCGGGNGDGITHLPTPSASSLGTTTPGPPPTAAPGTAPTPTAEPTAFPATSTPVLPTATSFDGAALVVRRGNVARNAVALTFDAGSDVGYTAQILDTLAANGINASFGITGRWAEQNPELLGRIVSGGHELINHTYDHASFTGLSTGKPTLSRDERWGELDGTEAIVRQLAGGTTKPYFRPPYGDFDDSVNTDVGARGYLYNVMWTVDSQGWRGLSAAEITQRCTDLAEPGAIYVFHVGGASQDGPALQSVIDGLRTLGYELGSLSEVLAP